MKEVFYVVTAVFLVLILWSMIVWSWEFTPMGQCEANGMSWNNIYIKCVPKGETFLENLIPKEEECNCCCNCCEKRAA